MPTRAPSKAPPKADARADSGRFRILGLDPGSRHTGYGLIDRHGSKLQIVAKGRISVPAKSPLPDRLARLCHELQSLNAQFSPDIAVLEALYRGVNARSLIVLAQARGALIATLAAGGSEIREYTPAEIKSAVTGNGRADKEQVATMVRLILGLGSEPLSSDASDALAVAICFAQRFRMDRLGASAKVLR